VQQHNPAAALAALVAEVYRREGAILELELDDLTLDFCGLVRPRFQGLARSGLAKDVRGQRAKAEKYNGEEMSDHEAAAAKAGAFR
jgi:hypothetical protein